MSEKEAIKSDALLTQQRNSFLLALFLLPSIPSIIGPVLHLPDFIRLVSVHLIHLFIIYRYIVALKVDHGKAMFLLFLALIPAVAGIPTIILLFETRAKRRSIRSKFPEAEFQDATLRSFRRVIAALLFIYSALLVLGYLIALVFGK